MGRKNLFYKSTIIEFGKISRQKETLLDLKEWGQRKKERSENGNENKTDEERAKSAAESKLQNCRESKQNRKSDKQVKEWEGSERLKKAKERLIRRMTQNNKYLNTSI